jgi:hypothetical protein
MRKMQENKNSLQLSNLPRRHKPTRQVSLLRPNNLPQLKKLPLLKKSNLSTKS